MIKIDRILNAAAEVLVMRPDATWQTVANAAGMSRTTFFYRYPTREYLIQALGMGNLPVQDRRCSSGGSHRRIARPWPLLQLSPSAVSGTRR